MTEQKKSDSWGSLATTVFKTKYAKHEGETWEACADRVTSSVFGAVPDVDPGLVQRMTRAIAERKFLPGGRYLFAAGREWHQTQNCLLLRAEDSSEGWAALAQKATAALMSGAGIGVDYSELRPRNAPIKRKGGTSTGPCALMQMINELGRHIMQGGSRRSAIWAGLRWDHEDVWEFVSLKDWPEYVRKAKETDFNAPAPMDGTNISVLLDARFFAAYEDAANPQHTHAHAIYDVVVRKMVSTGEPGFSIDYANARESLRNACTEVVSEDDSDICNLGSINMARIESKEEFAQLVWDSTAFLLAGTFYSDTPYAKVNEIRSQNRRLGLGLMGIAEFLLVNNRRMDDAGQAFLEPWLNEYQDGSDHAADHFARQWGCRVPVSVRAIAPTGSIGILAETTTGIEPIFCVAYKRRYLKEGRTWCYQYVVDPTAKRLIAAGVRPDEIEDALSLAAEPDRRLDFQAFVQEYVDNAISSTLNLPAWGSPLNCEARLPEFGALFMRHLKGLRGITCYPDGGRAGQPIVPVPYDVAVKAEGVELVEEYGDACDFAKGGTCGS